MTSFKSKILHFAHKVYKRVWFKTLAIESCLL